MNYINLERLNELKELDEDGSTLKELIRLFTKNINLKIKNIINYFSNQDYAQMRKEAHSLRSSGLNLGADKLGETLLKIEYSTDNDIEMKLTPAIETLKADCQSTVHELDQFLQRV